MTPAIPADTHSKVVGYLLWIFGFTGSHRFYYGRPVSGTIWFLTLGLLGVGWLIDVFLIYGLLFLDPVRTLQLWAAVLLIQMFAGFLAFAMERENSIPLLWMPLQQLAYRQLMYGVLIKSLGTALAGARLKWQKLKRVGDFGAVGAPGGAR